MPALIQVLSAGGGGWIPHTKPKLLATFSAFQVFTDKVVPALGALTCDVRAILLGSSVALVLTLY